MLNEARTRRKIRKEKIDVVDPDIDVGRFQTHLTTPEHPPIATNGSRRQASLEPQSPVLWSAHVVNPGRGTENPVLEVEFGQEFRLQPQVLAQLLSRASMRERRPSRKRKTLVKQLGSSDAMSGEDPNLDRGQDRCHMTGLEVLPPVTPTSSNMVTSLYTAMEASLTTIIAQPARPGITANLQMPLCLLLPPGLLMAHRQRGIESGGEALNLTNQMANEGGEGIDVRRVVAKAGAAAGVWHKQDSPLEQLVLLRQSTRRGRNVKERRKKKGVRLRQATLID